MRPTSSKDVDYVSQFYTAEHGGRVPLNDNNSANSDGLGFVDTMITKELQMVQPVFTGNAAVPSDLNDPHNIDYEMTRDEVTERAKRKLGRITTIMLKWFNLSWCRLSLGIHTLMSRTLGEGQLSLLSWLCI